MKKNSLSACGLFTAAVFILTLSGGLAAHSQPMSFRTATSGGNCDGCSWVAAEGLIEADTAEKLDAFLKREKINYSATIAFNSPGGSLLGGIKLGEFIRSRNLDTSVVDTTFRSKSQPDFDVDGPGLCASACALAYLGGAKRHLPERSKVGVHQFASAHGRSEADTQRTVALIAAYLGRMGVSRDLVLPMGFVRPDAIYWLVRPEAEKLNVTTDRAHLAEADWEMDETNGGLFLRALQRQAAGNNILYTLSCGGTPSTYVLVWAFELPASQAAEGAEIAGSIRGFSIEVGRAQVGPGFTSAGRSANSMVMTGANVPRSLLAAIAEARQPAELNLDMPHLDASYVGGWGQPFPRSNLGRLLPILGRNCR